MDVYIAIKFIANFDQPEEQIAMIHDALKDTGHSNDLYGQKMIL